MALEKGNRRFENLNLFLVCFRIGILVVVVVVVVVVVFVVVVIIIIVVVVVVVFVARRGRSLLV